MTAVWPLRPNWRESYQVTYAYKTDIITSEDGHEQRRRLRTTPRKTIQFQVTANADRFRALRRTLGGRQGELLLFPEVTRKTLTTAVSDIGSKTFAIESAPAWLIRGAQVLLVVGDQAELRTVDVPTSGSVTFVEANTAAWPVETWICWALTGRLGSSQDTSQPVNGLIEASIVLNVEPGSEPAPAPPAATTTFNGREVFLEPANWADAQDILFTRTFETVDYDQGQTATFLPTAFGQETRTGTFLAATPDQAQRLLDFFDRCVGCQGEFYAPSGEPELALSANVSGGSSTLHIVGSDLADAYADDISRKAISVLMLDGRRFYAEVDSLAISGSESLVHLVQPAPYALTAATVAAISWMPVCRLASDQIIMEWLTDGVAQTQIAIINVPADPVETL